MIFKSKFNRGDIVYFWSSNEVKILRGTISEISLWYSDKRIKWKYGIKPLSSGKAFQLSEMIPEDLIFREKDDVIDFCMKLTDNI